MNIQDRATCFYGTFSFPSEWTQTCAASALSPRKLNRKDDISTTWAYARANNERQYENPWNINLFPGARAYAWRGQRRGDRSRGRPCRRFIGVFVASECFRRAVSHQRAGTEAKAEARSDTHGYYIWPRRGGVDKPQPFTEDYSSDFKIRPTAENRVWTYTDNPASWNVFFSCLEIVSRSSNERCKTIHDLHIAGQRARFPDSRFFFPRVNTLCYGRIETEDSEFLLVPRAPSERFRWKSLLKIGRLLRNSSIRQYWN